MPPRWAWSVAGAVVLAGSGASAQTVRRTEVAPAEPEAGEVTIRARRPPREATLVTLDRREIQRIPGTGGDAFRAIQNLPGLARAPTLTGLLIVRGSAPQDTQVFLDGVDIPLLYHFGGLTSVVSSDLLERLDFYPGNFSARYGRAQGGIIDAGMRTPTRRRWGGNVNLNLIDGSFLLEGPLARNLTLVVAARRSWVDAVLGAVLAGNANVAVVAAPVYYDYQTILSWRPSPRDDLRAFFFGSDDALRLLFTRQGDSAPTGLSIGQHFDRLQLRWRHRASERLSTELSVTPGYTDNATSAGDLRFSTQAFTVSSRFNLAWQFARTARLNAGLDLQSGPVDIGYHGPSLQRTPGNRSSTIIDFTTRIDIFRPAVFAELELQPAPWLRLVPSLRMDYFGELRSGTISPRVTFRSEMRRGWFLRGGVGVFTQPPQFQESLSANDVRQPGVPVGNPNLMAQRVISYDLGVEHAFSSVVTASVEGFYKAFDSQVVRPLDPAFGVATLPYVNDGVGRAYGLEVMLRHRPTARFFGWVSYTLMRSERRQEPADPWRLFQFDQTHILTVIGSYRLGRGWELGLRFRLVSGNPYTARLGSTFNADTSSFVPIIGPVNGARLPTFHQLDLRVDKTWQLGRGVSLDLYLDVQNVYNHSNVEGVSYSFDSRQIAYTNGLPILPSLGVRTDF